MRHKNFWRLLLLSLILCAFATGAGAANYQDGIYRDIAEGYNGDVVVTVTVRGGQISDLAAENRSGAEPSEYMQQAIEGIRAQVINSQGVDGVDAVSGATGSSQSIIEAMGGVLAQAAADDGAGGAGNAGGGLWDDGAIDPNNGGSSIGGGNGDGLGGTGGLTPSVTPRPTVDPASAELFSGLGSVANFRVGPGKDDTGAQVYSFNVVMANALFDKDGRIMHVRVDIYEVSTPNYDGASMPHFSGWPGKEGYNVYDDAQGKVTGTSEQTEESAQTELESWVTKRERGDRYGMNPQNEWYKQMDAYEQWMLGKTTAEIREWFGSFTNANGRPIKVTSADEGDQKALSGMSDGDRQALVDLTSMATMSLSDSHGRILEAIEKAYENRTPVEGVSPA